MENATKALIMAGAILIAILLISTGLLIVNSTSGVVEESKKTSELLEAQVYNSNFTKYCGDRVLGSNVKDLQNFVKSYKAANPETNITVNTNGITISPRKYYKVEVTEYDDGYVSIITVTENS